MKTFDSIRTRLRSHSMYLTKHNEKYSDTRYDLSSPHPRSKTIKALEGLHFVISENCSKDNRYRKVKLYKYIIDFGVNESGYTKEIYDL